ncbi:hypothetical protein F4782DRAFT_535981 [Xylaria castorea]|nr:hypothetical protein F4782DRAFT_535981 [Xylaria castorea]
MGSSSSPSPSSSPSSWSAWIAEYAFRPRTATRETGLFSLLVLASTAKRSRHAAFNEDAPPDEYTVIEAAASSSLRNQMVGWDKLAPRAAASRSRQHHGHRAHNRLTHCSIPTTLAMRPERVTEGEVTQVQTREIPTILCNSQLPTRIPSRSRRSIWLTSRWVILRSPVSSVAAGLSSVLSRPRNKLRQSDPETLPCLIPSTPFFDAPLDMPSQENFAQNTIIKGHLPNRYVYAKCAPPRALHKMDNLFKCDIGGVVQELCSMDRTWILAAEPPAPRQLEACLREQEADGAQTLDLQL